MIGIVILAHGNLRRAAQLARHMAEGGCAVVIHADKTAQEAGFRAMQAAVGDHAMIRFAPRRRCEWGRFSLVEASLDAVRLLLATWPAVSHVAQVSGACIPLRPVSDLTAWLEAHRDTDFIEAIPVAADPWVIGGLSEERYTLFHPFSWKRQRWLFDLSVRLQRLARIRRRLPGGMKPCIGSQWWCLRAGTLRAILDDPNLDRYRRFWRSSWIADETFFQTLATRFSRNIVTTPLTFVRFDPQGKPYSFYDDHLELLLSVDAFFARKVWAEADRLYETFLGSDLARVQPGTRSTTDVLKRLSRARNLRVEGRRGMLGPGRHPVRKGHGPDYQTARPYTVMDGLPEVLPALRDGLNGDPRMRAHGLLFGPGQAEFFDGAAFFEGNLPSDPAIRDYRPEQFLVNLIWSDRRRSQVFQHDFRAAHPIREFILGDPNAQVIRLKEAWLLGLHGVAEADDETLRGEVRSALATEAWLETRLGQAAADVLSLSLSRLLLAPGREARRVAQVMPPYVDVEPLMTQIGLPEWLVALVRRLDRLGALPKDATGLAGLVAAHQRATTALEGKI